MNKLLIIALFALASCRSHTNRIVINKIESPTVINQGDVDAEVIHCKLEMPNNYEILDYSDMFNPKDAEFYFIRISSNYDSYFDFLDTRLSWGDAIYSPVFYDSCEMKKYLNIWLKLVRPSLRKFPYCYNKEISYIE